MDKGKQDLGNTRKRQRKLALLVTSQSRTILIAWTSILFKLLFVFFLVSLTCSKIYPKKYNPYYLDKALQKEASINIK